MISRADPQVMLSNIRWFYETSADPVEITNQTGPFSGNSNYSFSSDGLSLTIDNINQALSPDDSTDAGRYILEATNPAGMHSDYYELFVTG